MKSNCDRRRIVKVYVKIRRLDYGAISSCTIFGLRRCVMDRLNGCYTEFTRHPSLRFFFRLACFPTRGMAHDNVITFDLSSSVRRKVHYSIRDNPFLSFKDGCASRAAEIFFLFARFFLRVIFFFSCLFAFKAKRVAQVGNL